MTDSRARRRQYHHHGFPAVGAGVYPPRTEASAAGRLSCEAAR